MAESGERSRGGRDIGALAPLASLLLGLLFVWTVSVFAMRHSILAEGWARQVYPLLLWLGTVALWVVWQRPARPLGWLGLMPLQRRVLLPAILACAALLAWHYIRVSLSRVPGDMLPFIPPMIYVWILLGVLLNEVLLRGLAQTRLTELFGPAVAIPAAAVLTVLFRVPSQFAGAAELPFDPMAFLNVFIIALIAGALRHFCRSLWPAVAAQWGNAFGALL